MDKQKTAFKMSFIISVINTFNIVFHIYFKFKELYKRYKFRNGN